MKINNSVLTVPTFIIETVMKYLIIFEKNDTYYVPIYFYFILLDSKRSNKCIDFPMICVFLFLESLCRHDNNYIMSIYSKKMLQSSTLRVDSGCQFI